MMKIISLIVFFSYSFNCFSNEIEVLERSIEKLNNTTIKYENIINIILEEISNTGFISPKNARKIIKKIDIFNKTLYIKNTPNSSYKNSHFPVSSMGEFRVGEIREMIRMGVKVAFAGELLPHVVTTNIMPAKLVSAEMLDLSNLGLYRLPTWLARFSRLRSLNLANNKLSLKELEEVKRMSVLEVLNLNENPLLNRSLGVEKMESPLTELFNNLPNLRSLSLSNTMNCYYGIITCGDFKILHYLQKLDVSNNNIRKIDLSNISQTIQDLNLANNKIYELSFVDLPSLQRLSLQGQKDLNSNGRLGYLRVPDEFGDAFTMQQLRVLDFDSNVSIPKGLKRKIESWEK